MSLFLIGLRGVGKSAAGKLAAGSLGVPFFDADAELERRSGRSVAAIFRDDGEPAFRALERELLGEVLAGPGRIVATGGGAVLDADVRTWLARYGRVLWLTAPVAVLAERIRGSDRPPLLTPDGDAADELAALAERRAPLYRACADVCIPTEGRTLEEVARVIEHHWSVLPHHDLR